jgi:soluble lytic murein transglycosylase-like protein
MTRAELEALADQAARENGIPVAGFRALITKESQWNVTAVSPVGAEGIAQFMPATSAELGVDPWDPASALPGAARYLTQVRNYLENRIGLWTWSLVLAGYNTGMGRTAGLYETHGGNWLSYAGDETRDYIATLAPIFDAASPEPPPSQAAGGSPWLVVGTILVALSVSRS